MRAEVLVVGDANPDLLLTGDVVPRFGQAEQHVGAELALGGSGALAAAALVRLGVPTALAAALGDDELGALTSARLAERGIATGGLQRSGLPTGLTVHLLRDEDRAMLTRTGAIDDLDVAAACALIEASPGLRHVHLASVYLVGALRDRGAELVAAARAAGATVSVDTNDDPAGAFAPPAWLFDADVLLPNAREAVRLAVGAGDAGAAREAGAARYAGARQAGAARDTATGGRARDEVAAAAAALSAHGPLVVVKCGGDGALVAEGGACRTVPAAPAPAVVDAVGAGDAFDAGFIRGLLDGRTPLAAAALACACGALSLRAAGDAGQPTLAEALALEAGA
jgi:ribokinase